MPSFRAARDGAKLAAMREKPISFRGAAALGLTAIGVAAAWIYLLFFVVAPLSKIL